MKSTIKLVLLSAFAILTFNQTASAGLLLEPYLGYVVSGQAKLNGSSNFKGSEYGARAGYSAFDFAVGIEYAGVNFTDDSAVQQTLTAGDLGIFASFSFPILVRAYGTYIPAPMLKSSGGGLTSTYKSGNIVKLGVLFTTLPFVHVGLEYTTGTYSKVDLGGGELDLANNLVTTAYALVVTLPFDL
jgi:hypothetical protein